jgi:AcrR family transcriptional regulator
MATDVTTDVATDTKARILTQAERLFAEKDFSGTGIGEIAQRAGIAKSVIYHYFKSKDDILKTLIDDFIDEAVELNRMLPKKHGISTDDPLSASIDAVDGCMREMIEFMGSRKWMLKIILLQSVKRCGDVPLFDVVRKFQRSTEKCCGASTERINKRLADIQVADFFMNFLPIIGFLIFQDKWCDHVGMDVEMAKRKFIDTYVSYTRKVYWPLVTEG